MTFSSCTFNFSLETTTSLASDFLWLQDDRKQFSLHDYIILI